MKSQIVWLVLALSVLFNVFFAAGFVKARAQVQQAERPDEIARLVSERLDLDDAQRDIFARLRAGMADEASVFNDGIALAEQELIDELSKSDPDLEKIRSIVAQETDLHRQRRVAASRRFNEFLEVLSPDQCRKLSRHAGRGRRGAGRRPDFLKRFDANGDGELDESERAEARQAMEARRREHEARRQEMSQRFDADQDGQLDPEEREAMWEFMREQRRNGKRRGGPPPPPISPGESGR